MADFNWDQLANANLRIVCKQAFEFANSMDDINKGDQVAAILVFAKMLCDQRGIDLREALAVTQNIINEGERKEIVHIKALKHYINTALA
jgi:hypothetical protein